MNTASPNMPAAFDADQAQIATERAEVSRRQSALDTERQAGDDSFLTQSKAAEADYSKALDEPVPKAPDPTAIPDAPQRMPLDGKEYQNLATALLGMAMIGGGLSKGHWMGALSALNGALKGAKEGNDTKNKQAFEDYERKVDIAQKHDAAIHKQYEDILNDRKLTISEKFQKVSLLATEHQHFDMAESAKQHSVDALAHQADSRAQQLTSTMQRQSAAMGKIEISLKNAVGAPGGLIDADSAKEMAQQYVAGDKSVTQGLGRGRQGAENIVILRKAIQQELKDQGIGGADMAQRMAEFEGLKSGERALGTRTAQADMAVTEAQNLAPLALKASAAMQRSDFMPLAEMEEKVAKNTSSPAMKRFVASTNSYINVYARAINPQGTPTISDKDHARDVLSVADGQEAFAAGIDQLNQEMAAAQASPRQVKQDMRNGGPKTPTGGAHQPFADPGKEARYQQWKAQQNAGGQ